MNCRSRASIHYGWSVLLLLASGWAAPNFTATVCAQEGDGTASSSVAQSEESPESIPATPAAEAGKDEFDDAPSSPEALAAYAKAATFQNNAAFDLAAEAWESFLKAHADDPKSMEAKYHLGVCYLEMKQLAKATPLLEAVLEGDARFSRREDAFLNLGWAQYTAALQGQADQYALAATTFGKMLEEFPKGNYADQASFLRGESLYLQGKREQAVEAYANLVEGFPKSEQLANGLYALGVTQQELGQPKKAAEALSRFLEDFPEHVLRNEVRMRFAETKLQQGELEEAEKRFGEVAATDDFQDADHAAYRQAFCVARQERYEDAAMLFAAIPEKFPESRYIADANMASARAYYRAEKFSEAAESFEKLADVKGPYATEAAHWRARMLIKDKKFPEALELIDAQLPAAKEQKHPFLANLTFDRIDALFEMPDRRSDTIDLYAEFSKEFEKHALAPQALYNAAFAALDLKEYQRGLELTERFIKRFPEHNLLTDVKHVLAECRLQLGDTQGAAATFSELANANDARPEAGKWQLRQAIALFVQKDYRQALEQLTANVDSLTSPSEKAEAHYLIGMSHFGLQSYDAARDALSESLEVDQTWRQADEAMLNLARTFRKLKALDKATETAERMIDQFPESKVIDQAHFRLAEFAYASGDYEKASQRYEQVLEKWSESTFAPYALYGLGWSRIRLNDHSRGAESFGQLLDRYPEHDLARQSLYARAMSNQQGGQFDEALNDLDNYLKLEGLSRRERSDGLYVRGLSHVGRTEFDKAIAVLDEIIQTDPKYHAAEKVLYEVAWARKSSGDGEAALDDFKRLAESYPESQFAAESLYHVGEASYAAGEYVAAAEAYEKSREAVRPQAAGLAEKIRYKLGWSLYQQKDFPKAAEAFGDQIKHHPSGSLVGDAYFMLGECQFKGQNFADAIQNYAEASKRKLSSDQITTLTYLHAGQSAAQLGNWKISRDWLTSLANKFPKSPYILQVAFELGVAEEKLGNSSESIRLLTSVAERATGELSARARFMLGEVLYAQKRYTEAIVEFRKVMFGFDARVTPAVGPWQAKAGFEAGQCAGVVASQQQSSQGRQQYLQLARRFFEYVRTSHPNTDEARAATEQLRKYAG